MPTRRRASQLTQHDRSRKLFETITADRNISPSTNLFAS